MRNFVIIAGILAVSAPSISWAGSAAGSGKKACCHEKKHCAHSKKKGGCKHSDCKGDCKKRDCCGGHVEPEKKDA